MESGQLIMPSQISRRQPNSTKKQADEKLAVYNFSHAQIVQRTATDATVTSQSKVSKTHALDPLANTVSTLIEPPGFASKSIYLELPGTINSDVNHSGGSISV